MNFLPSLGIIGGADGPTVLLLSGDWKEIFLLVLLFVSALLVLFRLLWKKRKK